MTAPFQTGPLQDGLPDNAIEISGLTKRYRGRSGETLALDGVDLAIPRGSLFALLGPNGAGKSTLINILAGLVRKTSGTARIWGIDIEQHPRQAASAIGIVPQELNLDAFFTPREALELQAGMYGVPASERRTDEILARIGLSDKADSYARSLSGGMRRRLLVGKAMVHNPPVLVLDEPTAGVDIELRQQLWAEVKRLNDEGVTIVITTHYLEEAEALCDRIAIINQGRLVACEDKDTLLRRIDGKTLILTVERPLDAVPAALQSFQPELRQGGRQLVIQYRPSHVRIADILDAVTASRLAITDLSTEETDLEDIFLQLTRAARHDVAPAAAA
ncbi:MAG: ABC transporter ATP-binding protein [Alphaproteobacteria bacterium]|nr:ABC transporter ATP-binding protein [Alphaproteobacteria bacterium]MBU0795936.1 ABC transporter ATP-binding protein [Alphaproteobacteria bacterium]MBU0886973.1 ABC transporter ATP-binding protein [Alphaproteobacteria bacterium]MBU1813171.1 ABC transporter ATP-binding protein [Alphaproteobacteria bacterium]MBU2092078.1 ABC transporter ATP-binding protein [Alphaproteobacteria bacterium]